MKSNKKIAVICNYKLMPSRVGGMDRFFWLFDQECKLKGYEVVWFFPNKGNHANYQNLTVLSSEEKSLESFFLSHCKQNNVSFDVVITHFVELCTSFYKQVKKLQTAKIIAVDHNPRPFGGYPLKKRIIKRIKGILYSGYIDLFIGVSKYTKEYILNDFGKQINNKTKVIYNGILHELFSKRTKRNFTKPSFLVASHLRHSKGIQDLIVAISLLPKPIIAEIKIAVYGEGNYEAKLRALTIQKGVDGVFEFKGSVPNLFEIYDKYDYLLQPTHMECFSLSILESLSANVPVVTTAVGGNEEVVKNGENGFIFAPKDTNALKDILENLFMGKYKIINTTNEVIENQFSIDKMVAEHMNIL
jgi:L-malate glycosyltransferase